MRKGSFWVLSLALAALCCLFLFWPTRDHHDLDAFFARRDLSAIGEALYLYCKESGAYPPDLEFLRLPTSPLPPAGSRRLFDRKWSYVVNVQVKERKPSEVKSGTWLVRTSKPVGMNAEVYTLWLGGKVTLGK